MKLFKRKRRDTRQSAGELFQYSQLTGVTPVDIELSEQIRSFVEELPKRVKAELKHCGADHYNVDMFDERIHRAFTAEAEHKTAEYDRNLHTIYTIYQIHCGVDAHLTAQEQLYEEDIAAAQVELDRLSSLQSAL